MFPFFNPFFNRRRFYPRINQPGTPLMPTVGAVTHTVDAVQVVTYSLHPVLFRLLPRLGVMLLLIRHQPAPTPTDTDPVFLSVTGNPLGASSNRIPLMLPNGTQATVANLAVGGHFLVSFDRCDCAFQLLNPVEVPAEAAAAAAAPATETANAARTAAPAK